jgi:hypothetical protein
LGEFSTKGINYPIEQIKSEATDQIRGNRSISALPTLFPSDKWMPFIWEQRKGGKEQPECPNPKAKAKQSK